MNGLPALIKSADRALPEGWRVWAVWLAAWLLLFPDTAWSMVQLWWRSETYAHGFVVYPLAAWLVWRSRSRLRGLPLRPSLWGGVFLLAAAVGWLFGRVGDLLALEQLAWAVMLPAGVWALGGWGWMRTLAFPLAFTLFAVPLGEALVPTLQDFTAWLTVNLLRLTGIPVFWEGRIFSIPSGDFEVAETCSGVRYLYASLTFGALYAHLYLRGRRAWAFFALSALIPIIANGFRAYGIVMIAHLSDYKLAVGVDHYLYGWLFFGVVIALLVFIGERLRRRDRQQPSIETSPSVAQGGAPRRLALSLVLVLSALMLPRLWAEAAGGEARLAPTPRLVQAGSGWSGPLEPMLGWRPFYHGADLTLAGGYRRGQAWVEVHVVHYRDQTQGREIVNSRNRLYDMTPWRPTWIRQDETRRSISPPAFSPVRETRVRSREGRSLVLWSWYEDAWGRRLDPLLLKWDEIRSQLGGRPAWADLVVLAAPYDIDPEEGRRLLSAFLAETGLPLRREAGT